MAVVCGICPLLSPNPRSHVGHIRQVHSEDPAFTLECGLEGCNKIFTTFGAFNSHVYRTHRNSLGLDVQRCSEDDELEDRPDRITSVQDITEAERDRFHFDEHRNTEEIQYDVWHLLGVAVYTKTYIIILNRKWYSQLRFGVIARSNYACVNE